MANSKLLEKWLQYCRLHNLKQRVRWTFDIVPDNQQPFVVPASVKMGDSLNDPVEADMMLAITKKEGSSTVGASGTVFYIGSEFLKPECPPDEPSAGFDWF